MVLSVYWLIGRFNLLIIISLAALVYLICLYFFKAVTKSDFKDLLY